MNVSSMFSQWSARESFVMLNQQEFKDEFLKLVITACLK